MVGGKFMAKMGLGSAPRADLKSVCSSSAAISVQEGGCADVVWLLKCKILQNGHLMDSIPVKTQK